MTFIEWFKDRFSWPKFIVIFIVIWFTTFFLFKDRIMESPIAQAKMNALEGIMKADNAKDALKNIKEAIDTTLIQPSEKSK